MTDPRYLVPVSALPFVPAGVIPCGACPTCGRVGALDYSIGEPCCPYPCDTPAPECIDLSAPPKRDGIPERLDALGWALDLLAQRHGVVIEDIGDLRPMSCGKRKSWDLHPWGGRYVPVLTSDDPGWEFYDGDDLDQPRRIVAAALRNHVRKEPTP